MDTWIIAVVALLTAQAGFGTWLNSQFAGIRKEQASIREVILNKLEYHERHDDTRFSDINNSLWEIRLQLQNALIRNQIDQKDIKSNLSRETGS